MRRLKSSLMLALQLLIALSIGYWSRSWPAWPMWTVSISPDSFPIVINEAAGEVLMDEPLLLPNKQLRHRLVVRKISTGEITFSLTLDDSIAGIRAGGVNQQFITVGAFSFSDKLHSIFGIVDRKRGKFLRQDLGEFANHGVASNGRFAAHSEVLKSLLRLDSISLSDSGEVNIKSMSGGCYHSTCNHFTAAAEFYCCEAKNANDVLAVTVFDLHRMELVDQLEVPLRQNGPSMPGMDSPLTSQLHEFNTERCLTLEANMGRAYILSLSPSGKITHGKLCYQSDPEYQQRIQPRFSNGDLRTNTAKELSAFARSAHDLLMRVNANILVQLLFPGGRESAWDEFARIDSSTGLVTRRMMLRIWPKTWRWFSDAKNYVLQSDHTRNRMSMYSFAPLMPVWMFQCLITLAAFFFMLVTRSLIRWVANCRRRPALGS